MKINVRNEPATEAGQPEGSEATPARTCVWVVGDDGETVDTRYLEDGQQVTIETEGATSTGEVEDIAPEPPAGAEPQGS